MNRYICIHGHFYQPPRENPWLDEIETEDTAYPFHDWNERITDECYGPNAFSRILGSDKRILDIVNNYSKISFNFGPTLLSWLEKKKPVVYQAILNADRESQERYSGHGSAIAQVYNHIIMPLANRRDKQTEIIWGIKDFEYRFNRKPEGMWLPETAVDIETLEILADNGIRYTILAPHQAKKIRTLNNGEWIDTNEGSIDIGMPYLCNLPSGTTIALFFYNHSIANRVAFGNLLENGEEFAGTLVHAFPNDGNHPFLLSIANDGETYGHHHRFADMALAYAINTIEMNHLATITNYGEYLEKFPPTHEVIIKENTSWSCNHGVERWKNDCGCRTFHATLVSETNDTRLDTKNQAPLLDIKNWNQKWRKPLREAMEWLNMNLSVLFEKEGSHIFHSPWDVRNEYIDLMVHRDHENREQFLSHHSLRELSLQEKKTALKLLEIQKNALFMNTSCGWFFDEISGIETIQVMMYACRAMQLARQITGIDFEPEYISRLQNAPCNLSEFGTGDVIYNTFVKTAMIDIARVAFHYAITSLIEEYPCETKINTYSVICEKYRKSEAGVLRLCSGYAIFRSDITLEESHLTFSALHMGNHNFIGGIGPHTSEKAFQDIEDDLFEAFSRSDVPELVHRMDKHFEAHSYSLWHLFRDGKRKVLYSVLKSALIDIETEYKQIYRRYFSLLRAMKEMNIKPPEALEFPMEYTLNREIRTVLESDSPDLSKLQSSIDELIIGQYPIDTQILSFFATRAVTRILQNIESDPHDIEKMKEANRLFTLISPLSLTLDIRDSQNHYFRIGTALCDIMHDRAEKGDTDAQKWKAAFETLGTFLGVTCP